MIELDIYSTSPEDIELAKRYWAMDEEGEFKEKVASLLPFRSITSTSQLAAFLREISQAWDMNQICPLCCGYQEIRSRSEVKKTPQEMRYPCAACERSTQEAQREAAAKAEAELQKRLASHIDRTLARTIDYHTLPSDITLILIALERAINPRLLTGTFTRADCRALVPCYITDFIAKLYKAQAILDDPRKAKRGTYYLKDNQLWCQNDQLVYFLTPDPMYGADEQAFSVLMMRSYDDHQAIRNLWLDYAVADCMCYLYDQCELHSLDVRTEDTAEICSTLRTALQTYSVAQMWSMIWMIVRDAASLSTREYYNRNKASATIPGKMIRFLERVTKGTAKLKEWNRPEHQPAGTLGQVYMELFGIDEDTPGATVMAIFADPEPAPTVDIDPPASELAEPVKQLLTSALVHDIGAEVMLYFADSIRGGLNVASAIEEIFETFPILHE